LVECELPKEYNEEKHEDIIRQLGEELMECKEKFFFYNNPKNSSLNINKNEINMKNDDFSLLLCLLRKKKEKIVEKNPYYVDYSIKLEDVYINERDNVLGTEIKEKNDYIDVESFVKNYIGEN
jgi:hypothetical protein